MIFLVESDLERKMREYLPEDKSREYLLSCLENGDIFHARSGQGGSLICLVVRVNETSIFSRQITTQRHFRFDRKTGVADSDTQHTGGVVDSVEPLPIEMHGILLGLDRRYRLGRGSSDTYKLTDEEKQALLFASDFYDANPI